MATIKISLLNAISTVIPSTDAIPIVSSGSTKRATPDQITKAVLAASVANTNPVLIGAATSANITRFTNALTVVSNTASGIQQNETVHNIGLVAEGTANSANTSQYGIGLYGVGYTASATRCGGVVGEGHVSASADTGSAIGVRGYANDTHAGGSNIGLYGDAANGAQSYALYMNNGNIYSNSTQIWTIQSGGLSITGGTVTLDNIINGGLSATSAAAPTIASATTIAPTKAITFISGTTAIATITAPSAFSSKGGSITLIPTGIFTTTTAGNIALASTAVVGKALIMTYDSTTTKWYPSY